ncbi:Serine-threonine/tyrosine-protein kinase, catalytic domain [Sesbania bispinosa]|nr:Serine-threonine/tyrosine-protein kinase, catalytic domain [Sesbania bispinosa]
MDSKCDWGNYTDTCVILWALSIVEERRIEEEKLKQRKILYEIEGTATPSLVNGKHRRKNKIETMNHGLHMFSFESIELATDNFSSSHKLGEGGFGPVYKGQLLDGREIAIKRLSTSSRQGLTEFKNEISDFGLAKIFGLKEPQQNTNRVVGTYGYMAPEYALNGRVSTKIDVFSFGVLMLEIVSGKKNASNYDSDYPLNLIGHAWQLWNKGTALELIDPILKGSCAVNQVLRSIHISLLCVQDQAKDRPTMSDVVSFLSSEAILLAEPKQPAFFTDNGVNGPKCPITNNNNHSLNSVTISTMSGR